MPVPLYPKAGDAQRGRPGTLFLTGSRCRLLPARAQTRARMPTHQHAGLTSRVRSDAGTRAFPRNTCACRANTLPPRHTAARPGPSFAATRPAWLRAREARGLRAHRAQLARRDMAPGTVARPPRRPTCAHRTAGQRAQRGGGRARAATAPLRAGVPRGARTWYVLSNLSYMKRVMIDVLPTL